MGNFIDLKAADGFSFPAYVAQPAGQPRGAVVVLQEIFGVNSHIRNVADGYAAAGYLAVAPATFHRVKPGVELGYTPEDITAGAALKAHAGRGQARQGGAEPDRAPRRCRHDAARLPPVHPRGPGEAAGRGVQLAARRDLRL